MSSPGGGTTVTDRHAIYSPSFFRYVITMYRYFFSFPRYNHVIKRRLTRRKDVRDTVHPRQYDVGNAG